MIKRVIDVTQGARVSVEKGQLIVASESLGLKSCPIEDLGILLLSNPMITITHPTIAACVENNVVIVTCDKTFIPTAITLPISGHTMHAKILRDQIVVSDPRKKRLWQSIIKRKIREQGSTIDLAGGDSSNLLIMIPKVMSGDTSNVEAQAARVYWQDLFGKGFRRSQESPGLNGLLNYGYAILRAGVARAVVSAGLSPTLGIHHSNQFNAYALVDDLVEPYRPWIDQLCFEIVRELPDDIVPTINTDVKRVLLGLLVKECEYNGKTYPFMVALHNFAADFRENLIGTRSDLNFISR